MYQIESVSSDIERIIYLCPEVDCDDYKTFPPASDDELAIMESGFLTDTSKLHIFPFVRESCEDNKNINSKYIEIYVWNTMLYPDSFERFIIVEGYKFSEEKENDFFNYIDSSEQSYNHEDIMKHFYANVKKAFPQIHFKEPEFPLIGKAFSHIYYATHPGVKEILFKAGLDNIAYLLGQVASSYNILGSTPEEIIGLPLKLLRILNQREFICTVYNKERFDIIKGTYEKFRSYIGKSEHISVGQWRYLEELYLPEGLFYGCKFNRALYKRLCESESEFTLEFYKDFLEYKKKLPEITRMKLPNADDIDEVVNRLRTIYQYKNGKTEEKNLCIMRYKKERDLYEYHGEEFSVTMPKDAYDICLEALSQKNCIVSYIKSHAESITTILFIRKNDDLDTSYVTMEVDDERCIRQLYGKSNSIPTKEVFAFLEEYAVVNAIDYSPRRLLHSYGLIVDRPNLKELTEYVEDYEKRCNRPTMEYNDDDYDYVQFDLNDLIPGFF